MFDIVSDVKIIASQVAAVVGASAADGSQTTINRTGFESLAFDINVGAEADTLSGSVKFDFKVEHADDDGAGSPDSWEAVEAADLVFPAWATNMAYATGGIVLTVDAAAESPCVGSVGYVGGKKFVRCYADATGTTTGQPIAINARLSHPHHGPVS
jgi:hypothetical protein